MAAILVLNAGSSSIKFALHLIDANGESDGLLLAGQIDGLGGRSHIRAHTPGGRALDDVDLGLTGGVDSQHAQALSYLVRWLEGHGGGERIVAAGHRVVHGGEHYDSPVLVTPQVLQELEGRVPLAPLHQPHNLAAIRALAEANPSMPQVACFDTAFHRHQPRIAQLFALPRWLTEEGVRRYGFHGLSYESIATQLPAASGERALSRVVVAHLGNGASLCAMYEGRSVASSMGFTAVDGLMMGTRCGSLDPGVMLYLMQSKGWDAARLENLIYRESGLLGVSGIAADMRTLLASNSDSAHEAVELFCYRAGREIGSLAAALGGVDALVFTGGIGEHAAPVRARIARHCEWLGLEFDAAANLAGGPVLSRPASGVLALVLHTDEEAMIAKHTARLVVAPRAVAPA